MSVLLIAATVRELCPAPATRAVCCGIGPVEASLATAHALASHDCSAVLHVGIAGAAALPPGTVVLGEESIYCDVIDPNATLPRISRLRPTPGLLAIAQQALPDAAVRAIATTGRVGGGLDHPVEAMEGFGVLRAAALAHVPALELRVISNHPADADRRHWRTDDALQILHQAIRTVVPALAKPHVELSPRQPRFPPQPANPRPAAVAAPLRHPLTSGVCAQSSASLR